jgi:hypothetical protein
MIYVLCIYNKKEKENQITVRSSAEPFNIFRTIWLYFIIISFKSRYDDAILWVIDWDFSLFIILYY